MGINQLQTRTSASLVRLIVLFKFIDVDKLLVQHPEGAL